MYHDAYVPWAVLLPARRRRYPYRRCGCPFYYYGTSRGRSQGLRSRREVRILYRRHRG